MVVTTSVIREIIVLSRYRVKFAGQDEGIIHYINSWLTYLQEIL